MSLKKHTKNLKRIRVIISSAIFFSLLLLAIIIAKEVVERKSSDFKYIPFFEQKEDFDVLFMGTSHVINAVFPMELWDDYGIVSYNFGGHSNQLATTYWVMENAFDYTNPKLMVIDVHAVGSNIKVSTKSDYIHLSLDCFPVNLTKIRGIYDLCDEPDLKDENGICYCDRRWEFIWDLAKYHSRWEELKENDITNKDVTKEKGAESRIAVAVPNEYEIVDKSETLKDDTVGIEYLKIMIEDCQARDVDVLLINLPFPASHDAQVVANSVYSIAEEYGVNYINFVSMDSVVDYITDCYDPSSHLNPSGARKVTDYLGEYITANYDIPDRRKDESYKGWFEDYEKYVDYKISKIKEQTTIDTELMLLADKDFSCCFYIKEGSEILENEKIKNLLLNIMGKDESEEISDAKPKRKSYLFINDSLDHSLYECTDKVFNAKTSFGDIKYSDDNGKVSLFINDNENNLLDGEWNNAESLVVEPDIHIWVIDNRNSEIVHSTMWDYSITDNITVR